MRKIFTSNTSKWSVVSSIVVHNNDISRVYASGFVLELTEEAVSNCFLLTIPCEMKPSFFYRANEVAVYARTWEFEKTHNSIDVAQLLVNSN